MAPLMVSRGASEPPSPDMPWEAGLRDSRMDCKEMLNRENRLHRGITGGKRKLEEI